MARSSRPAVSAAWATPQRLVKRFGESDISVCPRALGVSDRLGTIEVGKWGDLFVVRGNPLSNIRHTRNVEWVMTRGELHRAESLRDSARGTVGAKSAAEAEAFKPERP